MKVHYASWIEGNFLIKGIDNDGSIVNMVFPFRPEKFNYTDENTGFKTIGAYVCRKGVCKKNLINFSVDIEHIDEDYIKGEYYIEFGWIHHDGNGITWNEVEEKASGTFQIPLKP